MATSLVAVAVSDVNSEAMALLTARLALLKASAMEQPANTALDAERTFLKTLPAITTAGSDTAGDRLIEEWKKVSAQRGKVEERKSAIVEIGKLLDSRWKELAAGQPSGAFEGYLNNHKALVESRRNDQNQARDLVEKELKWSEAKLKEIRPATADGSKAPAAGKRKGPKAAKRKGPKAAKRKRGR